jgi:hypothetical protein
LPPARDPAIAPVRDCGFSTRKGPDMTPHRYARSLRRWTAGAGLLIAVSGITASSASAQSCQSLWVERNSYYKDAGYCFKTQRAIGYFGNGGCRYDYEGDVPLPPSVRGRIAQIRAMERRFGCD